MQFLWCHGKTRGATRTPSALPASSSFHSKPQQHCSAAGPCIAVPRGLLPLLTPQNTSWQQHCCSCSFQHPPALCPSTQGKAILQECLLQKETFTSLSDGGGSEGALRAQTAFHSLARAEDFKDKSTLNHTQSAGRNGASTRAFPIASVCGTRRALLATGILTEITPSPRAGLTQRRGHTGARLT